jgi:hypothetical protein
MALQKSTRSRRAAPIPVSPDDLSHLIGAVAQDSRNLDAWRGELAPPARNSSGVARLMRTGSRHREANGP